MYDIDTVNVNVILAHQICNCWQIKFARILNIILGCHTHCKLLCLPPLLPFPIDSLFVSHLFITYNVEQDTVCLY